MSILLRLKNKLQDPSSYESKIREFDECMLLLKNENVELHKRIDQLEALCKTSVSTQQTHLLDEHIRQLEQENGRLFAENHCQRQEYVRFLDQLSTMVIRTAIMQENIRKECISIYQVIERLSSLTTTNAIQINCPSKIIMKERQKSLSWENLKKSGEAICNYEKPVKMDIELVRSSSRSSSSTTQCSISTSDSWTLDLKNIKTPLLMSDKPTEEEEQQVIRRSETFIITKAPQEELPSSLPMMVNHDSIARCPITRAIVTTPTAVRPSRLPCRRSNSKIQSTNNNNRSLSTPKTSKLPVRTTTSLNRQQTPIKKSNIPTPIVAKPTKDTSVTSNRSITSANNTTIKKTIRPPSVVPPLPSKTRSCSATTPVRHNTNTHSLTPINKFTRTTINTIESNSPIEQMNSTSSESSIDEQQQQINKLLPIVQDEGYSTWSSLDVKDDVIMNSIKKNEIEERQRTIGLVKTWLDDTSNRQCSKKPVNEVENDKLEEFTQELSDGSLFLCPFVRNRCSNVIPIPLSSTPMSSPHKDISLDSLDSPRSKEETTMSSSSSSSSIFSCSETFEKILITQTLSNITDDLVDTTSSASSTFNMSEYMEDHFIDQDDNTSEQSSSSFETTILDTSISLKPQKRLLFPGVLNRLIFFRRISSDSDLRRKEFYINENGNQSHVYHSNIINEHSVEVHLVNTYGSDTELHVWSHDCAEQRRFLNERQQQQENQVEENKSNHENNNQQLAVERQILLQQIFEYPWLLQENDLDRMTGFSAINLEQPLVSPSSDLIVPSHNPDFYQLCALTNSSSFVLSYDPNARHTTTPTTSSVL